MSEPAATYGDDATEAMAHGEAMLDAMLTYYELRGEKETLLLLGAALTLVATRRGMRGAQLSAGLIGAEEAQVGITWVEKSSDEAPCSATET